MDPAYAAEYEQRYTVCTHRFGPCSHTVTPETTTPARRLNRAPSHKKAWRALKESGQTHCPYCRSKFGEKCLPTFDHVVPKANGGTLEDGFIVVCQPCNSARGDSPYEEYLEAVEEEWRLAKLEGRSYKRPKRINLPDGSIAVMTLSKKERKEQHGQSAG